MTEGFLEHVNITVSDANKTADTLCNLFGWHIRWQGDVSDGAGRSVHVGGENSYLALYSPNTETTAVGDTLNSHGGLNHVGVVVDDLDAAEKRVIDAGYKTGLHADYEPGRRFYFDDENGIEFEVVSYA